MSTTVPVQPIDLVSTKVTNYKKTLFDLDLLYSNAFRVPPVVVGTVGMFSSLFALTHYRRCLRVTASILGPAYIVQGLSLASCYIIWRPLTRKFAVEHQGGTYNNIFAGLHAAAITLPIAVLVPAFCAGSLAGFQAKNSVIDFRKAIIPPTIAQKGLVGKYRFWAKINRKLGKGFYLTAALVLAVSFYAGFYQYNCVEEAIKRKQPKVES